MSAGWYRHDTAARTITLNVHVQPNARKSGIRGLHGDALRVRVAAPAVDNKANAAVLDCLAQALGRPVRSLEIRHGLHSRRKTVAIAEADASLIAVLEALAAA